MALEIFFHKVGAGHAVHAFLPDGKLVVVDLGCSADFSPLGWLKKQGRTKIDHLVITHPHGDHLDEILLLNKLGFAIEQVSCPRWLTEQEVREANQSEYKPHVDRYLEMTTSYNQKILPERKIFQNPANAGGAMVKSFWSNSCDRTQINNHSGVVSFNYASSTVVVPGDNESPSWRTLLEDPEFVATVKAADVFLASHHGRESGYCADVFADDRKPRLFVVSDGGVRDTDASPLYTQQARGWLVHSRDGTDSREKKVVTTRSNGTVHVKYYTHTDGKPYLVVTVDTFAVAAAAAA
jgi:beta-lactamase superfamily II metal-dependent hydrolase